MANNNDQSNIPYRIKKYFVPPPVIGTYFEYIDVNKDEDLRKSVTEFFHKKIIKWVSSQSDFSHLKNYKKNIESSSGYNITYDLIRSFIKEYNINWYDLKEYYPTFKDYVRFYLTRYLK